MHKNHVVHLILLMLSTSILAMEGQDLTLKRMREDSSEDVSPSKRMRLNSDEEATSWPTILAQLVDRRVEQFIINFYQAASKNPNVVDHKGYTPLMTASFYGHDDVVQKLLHQGADYNTINARDLNKSALHYAAQNGHANVMYALLLKAYADGTSIDLETAQGDTAVSLAYLNGHRYVAFWLLSQNFTGHIVSPACKDHTTGARTLFDVAIGRLDVEFANALFTHQAKFVDNCKLGLIGVALAAKVNLENLYEMIKFLIKIGANADMSTTDMGEELTTTLSFALKNAGDRDISAVLQLLIRAGANPYIKLPQGTLLALALRVETMHILNIQMLCQHVQVTLEDCQLAESLENRQKLAHFRTAQRRAYVQRARDEELQKASIEELKRTSKLTFSRSAKLRADEKI